MIGLLLALQVMVTAAPAPPAAWSALPPLRLAATPDYQALMTAFVRDEVAAGRCTPALAVAGKASLKIDMPALIAANGAVLRIVPKAIKCQTVEQFAAGVAQKAVRGNLAGAPRISDHWYRASMIISWGA